MKFEGTVYKNGKFWISEIPALDLETQGRTKAEALRMAGSVVEDVLNIKGFKATIESESGSAFFLSGSDKRAMIALLIRRQREKHGVSVREASRRMGSESPNAFGAYEQNKSAPSVDKLDELLTATGAHLILNVS